MPVIRTQIQLTEEQSQRLKRVAIERGVSIAEVIRDAIDNHVRSSSRSELWTRARAAVGGGRSGHRDVSVNHDRYLAEDFLD